MAGLFHPAPKATVLSEVAEADLWAEVRAMELSSLTITVADENERQELINHRQANAEKVARRFFNLLCDHLSDEAARAIFANPLKRPAGRQKDRAADIILVTIYDIALGMDDPFPKHQLAMFVGDLVASLDRYQGTTSGKALARRLRALLKERERKMSC